LGIPCREKKEKCFHEGKRVPDRQRGGGVSCMKGGGTVDALMEKKFFVYVREEKKKGGS